ncbi:TetR/AcrR family transcriptional regulator [uncultured Tenacibaculum sp.]|uniref:TetR/AcrR family transcriptional regulator n=1 Tax=uncultured Tenacibaculum sp. TaxID=174713 RepID=UPI002609D317|nr:TetR/AcrR family transcriptional regulator [uncultured Tenacibaculum sp.]
MRPQKVLDIEILAGLSKVFRSKGYEGASLKDLSDATGLKKASLYHRFPDGKKGMADAVLNHIDNWVDEKVFFELLNTEKTPKERLKTGLEAVRVLYKGGEETCIFRALSMQSSLELFENQISGGMKKWINTFETLGLALGFSPTDAKEKAYQTLIKVQGSLIVTKGLNDITIFENTLVQIENEYLDQ